MRSTYRWQRARSRSHTGNPVQCEDHGRTHHARVRSVNDADALRRCQRTALLVRLLHCFARRVYSRANWHASHACERLHFDGTRAKYDIKSISTRNPKPVIEISKPSTFGGGECATQPAITTHTCSRAGARSSLTSRHAAPVPSSRRVRLATAPRLARRAVSSRLKSSSAPSAALMVGRAPAPVAARAGTAARPRQPSSSADAAPRVRKGRGIMFVARARCDGVPYGAIQAHVQSVPRGAGGRTTAHRARHCAGLTTHDGPQPYTGTLITQTSHVSGLD